MATKKTSKGKSGAVAPKFARPPRVGELILVEHGISPRGQIALVMSVAGGLFTVRKFVVASSRFGAPTTVPAFRVKGKPAADDLRVKAAREAAKALKTEAAP